MTQSVLVTGAAGQLGRRAVEYLLERGVSSIVAVTRKPESLADLAAKGVTVRGADFDDESSLPAAFDGVSRALLVSTDAVDRPGHRLEQHRVAVRALEKAGVTHVVYTSLPNPKGSPVTIAADHDGTEEALAASKLDYTILRNNLYADLLLFSMPGAIASGRLVDARPAGAIAWVTRDDCARAAAGALIEGAGRQTFDVTGPEALTSDALASIVSRVSGKSVSHVAVPPEALVAGMIEHGLPRAVAELMASFDAATEQSLLADVTDTVERFGKRRPRSVADFLTANAAALATPVAH